MKIIMNEVNKVAVFFIGSNDYRSNYKSKVSDRTVLTIKNSLINLSGDNHFYDYYNDSFHRESDLINQINIAKNKYKSLFVYILSIVRVSNDGFLYIAHKDSTPGRLRTHIEYNKICENLEDSKSAKFLFIDTISNLPPKINLPVKSNIITYLRIAKTGSFVHTDGSDKITGLFAEVLEKFVLYLPKFNLNSLLKFICYSIDEIRYSPASLYKISGDLFLNKFSISPNQKKINKVWGTDPDNFESESKGSREDGIQNLYFTSQDIRAREESEFIARFFAYTDESNEVKESALRFLFNKSHSKITRRQYLLSPLIDVVDFKFVKIPSGSFWMGSNLAYDEHALKNETPQHQVHVNDYEISTNLISNYIWNIYLRSISSKYIIDDSPLEPVTYVSWYEAVDFCDWLTFQLRSLSKISLEEYITLPSEAEWEKAARGDSKRIYPWGDQFDSGKCNCRESNYAKKTEVGFFSPEGDSFYGIKDMAGNVWEWTRSLWGKNGNKSIFKYPYVRHDGRENLQSGSDVRRVIRGGAFYYFDYCVRVSTRNVMFPITKHSGGGFRIVLKNKYSHNKASPSTG